MLQRFINRFEEIIGAGCLAVMVTIAFINVVTRYFLRYSMAFTEELTLYLFVWVVMLGTSLAFREGTNMAVTFFYNRFGSRVRKTLEIFGAILSIIFFVVLAYFGVIEVIDEFQMGAMTEAIELPVWLFTGAIPIASVFTVFRIVIHTRNDFKKTPLKAGE